MRPRTLYLIVCGSGVASDTEQLVQGLIRAHWQVCVILTPQATKFVDRGRLEVATGFPVRSDYKRPEDPDVLPRADAILVYPATFNTLNKWAGGICDTLALGLLAEYTGFQAPIVAVPCIRNGSGLDTHPVLGESLGRLRSWGIDVVHEPDLYPPINRVPDEVVIEHLERAAQLAD